MDLLTHLFLPLTGVYVLRRDLFDSPLALGLAAFAVLPDFDKFLGLPGLLHSLVTLTPVCVSILAVERYARGRLSVSPVVVGLVASHLLLDLVDGGPVTLLYPWYEVGVGLQFPSRTVFGAGPVGLWFEGPFVQLRTEFTDPGNRTYGFLRPAGIANALLFAVVYVGDRFDL